MAVDALTLALDLGTFVAVGALVGFVAGLIRSGGGMLGAPLLIHGLDGHGAGEPHVAVATALGVTLLLSLHAVAYHARHGAITGRHALPWAVAAFAGGLLGGWGVTVLTAAQLLVVLGSALIGAAILLLLRDRTKPLRGAPQTLGPLLALPTGALSAATGAGGGTFVEAGWRWVGLPQPAAHAALLGTALALGGLGPLLLIPEASMPLMVGAVSLPGVLLMTGAAAIAAPHGARLGAGGPKHLVVWIVAFGLVAMGFSLLRVAVGAA